MPRRTVVIFDRSAFHGDRFDLLRHSALAEQQKRGRVVIHHVPVFLEETVSMYEKETNRNVLRAQLPFILSIFGGHWFLQRSEIWWNELVRKRRDRVNPFLNERLRKDTEARMLAGVLNDKPWTELFSSLRFKDEQREKQGRQHDIFRELRQDVERHRRELPASKLGGPHPFEQYCKAVADEFGNALIEKHVRPKEPARVYERWRRDKLRYPFFTSFVEGLAYIAYYAMVELNRPLDRNAQVDIELLCYMNWADVLVTEDTKFMRSAFEAMWTGRDKKIFSVVEFTRHLAGVW